MPLVVWAAIAIEVINVQMEWPHAAAATGLVDIACLVVLQLLNVLVGFVEEMKAAGEIAELKSSLRPKCTVKRMYGSDVVNEVVDTADLVPGDIVCLGAGGAIPADCRMYPGNETDAIEKPIYVDQAALTGESLPVIKRKGDTVMMSTTVSRGEAEAVVVGTGLNTEYGKTQRLIQDVAETSNFERVLQNMLVVLIAMGVIANTMIVIFMANEGIPVLEILSFNVVLLIASIPVALRVVCVSTLAVGCRELAQEGAIVSRLSAIEELAGMTVLCSDKTGTLTLNKMQLQDKIHVYNQGVSSLAELDSTAGQRLLFQCALATKWWEPPRDAIDKLVHDATAGSKSKLDLYEQVDFLPFDPSIKRTAVKVKDKTSGRSVAICKGAPAILLDMCCDKDAIKDTFQMTVRDLASRGVRCLAIIEATEGVESLNLEEPSSSDRWRMTGILTFLDPPRPDTKRTVHTVAELGAVTKMITGDDHLIAAETARVLGMTKPGEKPDILLHTDLPDLDVGELQTAEDLGEKYGPKCMSADGFAGVFPAHKYLIVQALRQLGHIVGMTGDGVNDAPALKRADIGIAVMGATDAARASSDIVLTREGLSTIAVAILVARQIFARMQNFIIYRVACTWQLLFFFLITCMTTFPNQFRTDWPAHFSMPVISLVTITILNDGTIISVAFDNVRTSVCPEKWNLKSLFFISSSIGFPALLSSLALLYAGLDSGRPESLFGALGLEPLEYGQLMTMMYLKVSLSDYLSLFNARTRSWMWSRSPSPAVLGAGALATALATLLSAYWPFGSQMMSISWPLILTVWAYTLVASFFQDVSKMAMYKGLAMAGMVDNVKTVKNEDVIKFLKDKEGSDSGIPIFEDYVPYDATAANINESKPLLAPTGKPTSLL